MSVTIVGYFVARASNRGSNLDQYASASVRGNLSMGFFRGWVWSN
ncbi:MULTISPECIES: hypothetical protein [Mesorhizobium]|nr:MULTISPECIES: hypothetical protein [Mesorhizobium]MCQ8816307.1 hypothetical protein [Mesorhizobium sp. SEMIA396]